MRWIKLWLWGLQKPTNGVVREERRKDIVVERFIMLIVNGFLGLAMLLLILFT